VTWVPVGPAGGLWSLACSPLSTRRRLVVDRSATATNGWTDLHFTGPLNLGGRDPPPCQGGHPHRNLGADDGTNRQAQGDAYL
jgi:hypothetical protein